MICLGSPQSAPTPLEAEAAQLRIVQLFRADFLRRYPDGIVISELEYMGRTTAAPNHPGPLVISGKARLTAVMAALASDFRRWIGNRDYRKCDAMGISGDGVSAELLEVTTVDNAASAAGQIISKLAILRETVNRIHNLAVDWRPTIWRPGPDQLFYSVSQGNSRQFRYLCFQPTYRAAPPAGVILYEVHVAERPQVPVPIQIPQDASERLRRAARDNPLTQQTAESWARRFLAENPIVATVIRALAFVAGVIVLIGAIILIFDPVPGDEAAAAAAAMWLISLSLNKSSGQPSRPPGVI
jgi:hypothetical protein